jgi:hypothetical protein
MPIFIVSQPETGIREDDFVGVDYIMERTRLARRTILRGKAGTSAITRVNVRPALWNRASVDKFVSDMGKKYDKSSGTQNTEKGSRDFRLLRRRRGSKNG